MKRDLIVKTGKDKYKIIKSNKYVVDRNTPVGDPADYYEIRPYDGRKPIYPLAFINEDEKTVDASNCKVYNYEKK